MRRAEGQGPALKGKDRGPRERDEGVINRRGSNLGRNRAITRRDFLSGVSLALTSSIVRSPVLDALDAEQAVDAPERAPGYYPPALTGMRGSHPGSFEVAHQLRDSKAWNDAATD